MDTLKSSAPAGATTAPAVPMAEHIAGIQALAAANAAMKVRTPFLQVALGALTTAISNSQEHVLELDRQAKARAASLATLEAAKAAINEEESAVAGN